MTVKTFIDRPILSGVISVMLVIIGLIGLSQLPVEQFPDIAPPTVRVTATYTGANAETVTLPGGNVLRLGDVATVELGAENYALLSQTDGHPGANGMIAQTSGSNANEIIKEINATSAVLSADLPKGMVLEEIMSTKDFLDASIANVVQTLLLAIVLVVLVVYIFLHDLRATICWEVICTGSPVCSVTALQPYCR